MGGMFTGAFSQQAGSTVNPLLPLVLLFIWFISTFIGNIAIGWVYNLFFNRKYYNTSKMFGLLLLTNGILFFFFAPVYVVFANQIDVLFLILGFHILFSVFASAAQIEFSTNPNYSASSFMGNVLWFTLAFLAYALIYKMSGAAAIQQKIYLFMLLPSVIGYGLIPFWAGIREKIYYKFYELWNNWFYIASTTETEDDVDGIDTTNSGDEVNVEN